MPQPHCRQHTLRPTCQWVQHSTQLSLLALASLLQVLDLLFASIHNETTTITTTTASTGVPMTGIVN